MNSGKDHEGGSWWVETDDCNDGICPALQLGKQLHSVTSSFQKVEVYEHKFLGFVLLLDGILQTSTRDEFVYNEMLTHVPLLGSPALAKKRENKDPVEILIIGGGDGGVLREVLKHEWVKSAVMIEIDEEVVKAVKKHMTDFKVPWDSPRAKVLFQNGAAWVKEMRKDGNTIDTIVLDSTDPIGPGTALFTNDFYGDVEAVLKPGGVMSQQIGLPFCRFEDIQKLRQRLEKIFGRVEIYITAVPTYYPGSMAFVVCTKGKASGCSQPRDTQFTAKWYSPEIHTAAFALPPIWDGLKDKKH